MAGCAHPTGSAGHAPGGAKTNPELTFNPDHPMGADQADEVELDEAYATERHLFYVACTRARDRLLVTGVAPGSEFLSDLS